MNEMKPSCTDCPALLLPRDVAGKFKRSTGSMMCGRTGVPLTRPGLKDPATVKAQLELQAGRCGTYGEPYSGTPTERRFSVAIPDLSIEPETDGAARDACTSCSMCRNFVRDDTVAAEFGWTTGLCAAKGKLVTTNMQTSEAKGCEMRSYGAPRRTTAGVTLFPEYQDGFGVFDPIKEYIEGLNKPVVNPSEHATERTLDAQDIEDGIKAWRKIEDPESGNFTFLPIYDISTFSEADQGLVPQTGDDEHPELYVDHFRGVYLAAVCWSELDETPALWGQAGTGKTELFRHLAWLMQLPFRRISITGSTELDDLAGKMRFSPDKGTYFQYGRLPASWMKPGVICIDEPNTGAPDVWQFLRPLTDNSKQLILDVNEGEVIKRHDSCFMGMAMNPSWDVRNVGTAEIGDADANRLFHVYLELPPPELEREIIKARVKLDGWELSTKQMDMLMAVAKDIRGLVEQGAIPISWAIRPQIKVARALRWFDVVTAYRRAVGDYLEPEASEALLGAVRAHIE